MRGAAAIALALLALFMLPWQFGMLAVLIAALFVPLAGVALGIIAELFYYQPGAASIPWLALAGLAAAVFSYLVHRYVKPRIMEG